MDIIVENSQNKYGVPLKQVEEKIGSEYQEADKKVEERTKRRGESGLGILREEAVPKKKKEVDKDKLREALGDSLPKDEGAGN